MKYVLLKLEREKYWIEINNDGYASRQIFMDINNKIHISCLEDCLAEGLINEKDIEANIINITKQEIEDMWTLVLKMYEKQWEEIKKRYQIGTCIQGVNSHSYPQGTVIKGRDFFAIYKGNKPFYPNKLVQYEVKSYDNLNMWLVVE